MKPEFRKKRILQADHKSLFSPNLPQSKIDAIEGLGFGYNEKIFVEFERSACSNKPVDQVPSIAYQLLWDLQWPGPGKEEILHKWTPTTEKLPSWAYGIYSFRYNFQ